MDEYIKKQDLVDWCNETYKKQTNIKGKEYVNAFLQAVIIAPTADVVPRADFATQKAMADMCAEVIARQDKEIERLQEKANRYKRYYFHHDYDKMIAEVLDKLDRFINSNCIEIKDERGIKGYVTSGVHFAIAELKKKYTEGAAADGDKQ